MFFLFEWKIFVVGKFTSQVFCRVLSSGMDLGMGDASWNETGERDYRDYSPTEFEEHPETLFNAGRRS